MRSIAAIIVSAALLGSCGNFLNAGGAAAARWAALDQARANKLSDGSDAEKICKTMPVTGSTMPKRVCSTQAEWEAVQQQQREASERFNADVRNNSTNVGGGAS